MRDGPIFNAYPDSLGGTLADAAALLARPEARGAFSTFYILPSLYNSDLDRGFSVIDYGLDPELANERDLADIRALGVGLKLDFLVNHASVLSAPFQDLLRNGEKSRYRDFFIDWNRFWDGRGAMTEAGYIQPDPELLRPMFFRKPGLPLLMTRLPGGRRAPYWNTFYQEVRYPRLDEQDVLRVSRLSYRQAGRVAALVNAALDAGTEPRDIDLGAFAACRDSIVELLESRVKYLGQMDLNIQSPLVWEHYADTLRTLAGYGAEIVRLDAFAYAPKAPGRANFLNEPETSELLGCLRELAAPYGLSLLPEIHAGYAEGTYEKFPEYLGYDFFLPGLLLDALETGDGDRLTDWAREMTDKKLRTVNMLGCHDGIPLLDLKGMLPEERIARLTETTVARGGRVKDLHGQKNVYYQVNAAYFSALGSDERRLRLARAVQLFMPGRPQVWYLDLFAMGNDQEAVRRGGPGAHKEINRTNLTPAQVEAGLARPVVRDQLSMLRFRNDCPAFGFDATLELPARDAGELRFVWRREGCAAELRADLRTGAFTLTGRDATGKESYRLEQK